MPMQSKCLFIVLTILLFSSYISVKGQSDTIYVFEEVVVYDTVYIFDTIFIKPVVNELFSIKPKFINVLQLDTVNIHANLLQIFNQQAATFPINHIILNENFSRNIKKSESMKKLSFFGVVLFAFQSMVLAQTNYEISLGSGVWWESGKMKYVDKPISTSLNATILAIHNFGAKNFGFKTGIEYSYLFSNSEYKFDGSIGVWHTMDGSEFDDINSHYGDGLHNVTIPFLVYSNKYRIMPYLGVNYNYLTTGLQTSLFGTKSISSSHNIGLNIGTGFRLNEFLTINLDFKHNLTSDYGAGVSVSGNGQMVLGESYDLRNSQTRISLVYNFKKKNK